ncbi:hypothetical protein D9M68_490820 [compost metagenome]
MYEFEPALSYQLYMRPGVFSSYVYASFAEDKGVLVYPDVSRKFGGVIFRSKDCSHLIEGR